MHGLLDPVCIFLLLRVTCDVVVIMHKEIFVVAAEAGLRYPFAESVFAEAGVKGAYANYKGFLIADGKGSQKWFGLHFHFSVGANFTCQQK